MFAAVQQIARVPFLRFSTTKFTKNCCLINMGFFEPEKTSKQQTWLLFPVQVFLGHVQLIPESLFQNFHCSYLHHSTHHCALT